MELKLWLMGESREKWSILSDSRLEAICKSLLSKLSCSIPCPILLASVNEEL